ncbi:hypothetical protein STEG23_036402 [Scotinomys teguina]
MKKTRCRNYCSVAKEKKGVEKGANGGYNSTKDTTQINIAAFPVDQAFNPIRKQFPVDQAFNPIRKQFPVDPAFNPIRKQFPVEQAFNPIRKQFSHNRMERRT